MNWRGSTATGGACGSIGFNAGKLTGGDPCMKARLMTLPDFGRGGAWPSSVRTVRRSVKSDNERDPRPLLPPLSREGTHIVGTAGAKSEEGEVDGRSVCPECPGLHARYIGGDKRPLP